MKMNKKMFAFLFSFAMILSGLAITDVGTKADETDESVVYATVKSIADFRNYIDNENAYSFREDITTDWTGTTEVYTVAIPSDGKLLVSCLSPKGYVDGQVYSNFSLTSAIGEVSGSSSAREDIGAFDVKAGTYYVRGNRWNGTDPITVTVYIGFVPNSSTGVNYSDTSTRYDRTNNVTPAAISSKEELVDYINDNNDFVAQDTIETDWSGESEAHSFTVEENGWLFVYPLAENNYIDFQLFSNANLSSRILSEHTLEGTNEEPYTCYLSAGTYYFRGSRWNGTEPITFTTYMGFMKDTGRFSVVSSELSGDKTSASVTFSGESGLIRVEKGEFDVVNIKDDDFWKTENRGNALEGSVATITENGDYVARLETKDGYYVMVPFTISGLIELSTPAPTLPASPTPTLKPMASPNGSTTTASQKVYKVKVTKKNLVVKVKKKVTIQYSVTAGYKGKVKFSTSNKKIATVSAKGVVTGKKKGNCKITLKLNNGKKAVVNVKVKK